MTHDFPLLEFDPDKSALQEIMSEVDDLSRDRE